MKQPNYRFAVSDPRDVDFARIISEAGEQEIILLTGGKQHEAYSTSLLMVSLKFLARFYGDDGVKLLGENLRACWGYSHVEARANGGELYFISVHGDSNLPAGWRAIALSPNWLGGLEQEIAAARDFVQHNKRRISVRYL